MAAKEGAAISRPDALGLLYLKQAPTAPPERRAGWGGPGVCARIVGGKRPHR